MSPSTTIRCAIFSLSVWVAFPLAASASPELRKELAEVAKSLKQLLDGRGEDSIVIGQFTGPANFPTSAGPGISQILGEELKKMGKSVKRRAKYGVEGKYLVTEVLSDDEPQRKLLAIKLMGSVTDEFGKVIADFSFDRTLKGEGAFVELMGASVDMTAILKDPVKRGKKLRAALATPQANIRGNRVYASDEGKYAIELLIEEKPRLPKDDDGLAYVKIDRGERYAVRLINDSDLEMAVNLSIDGLNVFTFSELRYQDGEKKGQPLYSVWIVPAKSSVVIYGWHRNNEDSDDFQVMEYAKTAAATIGHKANIGTITASFAAAWPEGEKPPQDEPGRRKGTTLGDGTGFGPSRKVKVTGVKRTIGAIRSSVSVRYSK